jgi:hypothetical protein
MRSASRGGSEERQGKEAQANRTQGHLHSYRQPGAGVLLCSHTRAFRQPRGRPVRCGESALLALFWRTPLRNLVIVLAVALAFGSFASSAACADDTQSKIQAAYDAQCKAFIAKDGDAFQKTFDPKYTATDLDGKQQALADIVNEVTASTPGIAISTCTFTIRKVTVKGATATVLATATAAGTMTQNGGASAQVSQVQETTDTWNVAGAPLETSSVETGLRATVGGKVVQEKGTFATPTPSGR